MDRRYTKQIASLLSSVANSGDTRYKLAKKINSRKLTGFHQWADGHTYDGAFLFKDQEGHGLWIVLIDWRGQNNFYVVLFPESKSGPVAEIHKIINERSTEAVLSWRYSPSKRDGRNEERKEYFRENFLSDEVQISVPRRVDDVDGFIEELFSLAGSRLKADELNPERPSARNSFPEGKEKERLHISRERNAELVRRAKDNALKRYGCLKCACCGFDFLATYGEVGRGFIEAHHTKPLSSLHEDGEETHVDDLALVCSNCHRMLHRSRPWLGMNELSELLTANKPLQADAAKRRG